MRLRLLCLPPLLLAAATACDAPDPDDTEGGEGEGETAEGEGEGEPAEGEGEGEVGEGEGEPAEGEGEGEGELVDAPLCVADFCWELPLPAAATLHAIVVDGERVIVGSDAGDVSVVAGDAVASTSSPLPFVNSMVRDSTGTVWVSHGPVWRLGSPAPEVGVTGVFGMHAFADDDIWGVGTSVYRYNGLAWVLDEVSTGATLLDVHGVSASDLWAVGLDRVRHRTDEGWQDVTVPTSTSLQAVWANAADDVWVAGDRGTALHFDGTAWTTTPTEDFVSITDLRGFAADDVWATSDIGLLHWDGTSWSVVYRPGHALFALDGTATDLWAVGANGYIGHYDGSSWSRFATGGSDIDANIYDLSVAPTSGTAVALGRDFGTNQLRVLERNNGEWSQGFVPDLANPFGVLALDDGESLLFGSGLWRGSGSTWEAESLPVAGQFRGACSNGDVQWAAGYVRAFPDDSFTLLRHTNAWREAYSDTSVDLFSSNAALWCTGNADNDEVWAQSGTATWRNTPAGVVRTDLASFRQLKRAVAFAPNDAWGIVPLGDAFTPEAAAAFHYDGTEWASAVLPGDDIPVDVTRTSDGIWIQGQRGAWRVVDGVATSVVISAVGGPLPAVKLASALDDDSIMIVGSDDSVWHVVDDVATRVVEGAFSTRINEAVFTGPDSGFAAGDGLLQLVNGTWTSVPGVFARVSELWRTADDDIWAVGDRSVLHFDGASWTEAYTAENFEQFYDVWASGPNDVWIVGAEGTLLHKTAAGFASVPSTVSTRTHVFGSGAGDVWFVGISGPFNDDDVIVEHKGAGATLSVLSVPGQFVQVQRIGDVVLSADRRGGVWRRTATSGWQELVAPQEPNVFNDAVLTAMHFISEDDGYAVVNQQLATFIGDGFLTPQNGVSAFALEGVGDDVYALSAGGVLHHAP